MNYKEECDKKMRECIEETRKDISSRPCLAVYEKIKINFNTIIKLVNIYTDYNNDYPFKTYNMQHGCHIFPRGVYNNDTVFSSVVLKFMWDSGIGNEDDFKWQRDLWQPMCPTVRKSKGYLEKSSKKLSFFKRLYHHFDCSGTGEKYRVEA